MEKLEVVCKQEEQAAKCGWIMYLSKIKEKIWEIAHKSKAPWIQIYRCLEHIDIFWWSELDGSQHRKECKTMIEEEIEQETGHSADSNRA
jgi:hypothetical protein